MLLCSAHTGTGAAGTPAEQPATEEDEDEDEEDDGLNGYMLTQLEALHDLPHTEEEEEAQLMAAIKASLEEASKSPGQAQQPTAPPAPPAAPVAAPPALAPPAAPAPAPASTAATGSRWDPNSSIRAALPTSAEAEEEMLRRALELSMQEAGGLPQTSSDNGAKQPAPGAARDANYVDMLCSELAEGLTLPPGQKQPKLQ